MEILFFIAGSCVGVVAFNKTKIARAYRDLRLKYEISQDVFNEIHERFKLLNKKIIPRLRSEINFKTKALILEKESRARAKSAQEPTPRLASKAQAIHKNKDCHKVSCGCALWICKG